MQQNIVDLASDVMSRGIARSNIETYDNLADFCESRGFLVDGRPFDLSNYRYLEPIYRDILTLENLSKPEFSLVLRFGAQTGKTVLMTTLVSWLQLVYPGSMWGYYFPAQQLAHLFSSERYEPLIRSNSELHRLMESDDDVKRKQSIVVRHLGLSSVYFLWTTGVVTTESFPFWGVFYDEVRRMAPGDVERVKERIQASPHKIDIKASTAGFPGSDIDAHFSKTNQNHWHTRCDCPDGIVLADHWPDCIGEDQGGVYYLCPECRVRIENPQDGYYKEHNPGSSEHGFTVPQILSPRVTPRETWKAWNDNKDRQEFFNSKLGKPWISTDTQPVTDEVFNACINENLKWQHQSSASYNFMGMDQRGLENHIAVVHREPGSKGQVIYVEIIQNDDPFKRAAELIKAFNVLCCVVDENPNYNEAVRFAKRFKETVFLCTYHAVREKIRWVDKMKPAESVRKTKHEDRFTYCVRADRYKTIDETLQLWVNRQIEIPPPMDLVQNVRIGGDTYPVNVALGSQERNEPGLLLHLKSVARVKMKVMKKGPNDTYIDTGIERQDWQNLRNIDPHWLHALNYAMIASQRDVVLSELFFAESENVAENDQVKSIKAHIVETATGSPYSPTNEYDRCLECAHFMPDADKGRFNCNFRKVITPGSAPACDDGFEDLKDATYEEDEFIL